MDRKMSVARITDVIGALNADIVAVQEIIRGGADDETSDQVAFVARALGYHFAFGQNRTLYGWPYGNATFSRLPIAHRQNYDITWHARERRGCLRTDLRTPAGPSEVTRRRSPTAGSSCSAQKSAPVSRRTFCSSASAARRDRISVSSTNGCCTQRTGR
jgi:hypothetical protein